MNLRSPLELLLNLFNDNACTQTEIEIKKLDLNTSVILISEIDIKGATKL